ncbi:MAG: helix-turn-helix domain-containing protein [Oscillospiraceae bacterium]|nr:helix-turn-helix domain-containing protein [Oscillospiraceae bacterium]
MLARYVGDLFEQLVVQMASKKQNAFETYSLLVEYLSGSYFSPDAILSLQNQLGFLGDIHFTLYKIVIDSTSQAFFSYLLDRLRSLAEQEIVFPFQDSIVYISQDTAGNVDAALSHLPDKIGLSSFRCGVSFPFPNLTFIKQAYYQADFALKQASPQNNVFFHFETVAFSGMIAYLKSSCEWRPFVPPSLLKLVDSDLENRTDYTKTLLVFLLNYGHAAETANQLFIHRNTLRYRLERIKDICGIDAQDKTTAVFLRFCFSFLEEDLREIFHHDDERKQKD